MNIVGDDFFEASYLCFTFSTSHYGKLPFTGITAKLLKKKYVARALIKQQY